jgi:hypothetical protein
VQVILEKRDVKVFETLNSTPLEREWLMEQLKEMVKHDIAYLFQVIMESRI